MSHAALTAKYRPQTFARVAGQETIKAILSRASLEQRVAPAYLFSGTRGVGKTTLARIFAKALNCRTAPTAEPCNACDQCRAITAGSAVDVVEIDGASNRGIDDVRRLKEVVGYAPMEGAYKIFIIDEAHMLSREAFNALLKTLEEPPGRVTFIMATTEPHKFPATIISRCQHYVFKQLAEKALVDHLSAVLHMEQVAFEAGALRLIARRGAGSVRDAMSLLGQVLALREGTLTEEAARSVLGLAGQEVFFRMMEAFEKGDAVGLSLLLRDMLDQGLDMGFFLRELSSLWRNLFMLRQSGEAALPVVDLPEDEARACLDLARKFSLPHIHACWQMTLEGQRRVLTSLEPALALELLLLNLSMLPRLLSLEQLSSAGRRAASTGGGGGPGTAGGPGKPAPPAGGQAGQQGARVEPRGKEARAGAAGKDQGGDGGDADPLAPSGKKRTPEGGEAPDRMPAAAAGAGHETRADPSGNADSPGSADSEEGHDASFSGLSSGEASDVFSGVFSKVFAGASPAVLPEVSPEISPDLSPEIFPDEADIQEALHELSRRDKGGENDAPGEGRVAVPGGELPSLSADAPLLKQAGAPPDAPPASSAPALPEWEDFVALCGRTEQPAWLLPLLQRMEGRSENGALACTVRDEFTAHRLADPEVRAAFETALIAWCGRAPDVSVTVMHKPRKSRDELKAEVMEHPLVKEAQTRLGAYVIDYGQLR